MNEFFFYGDEIVLQLKRNFVMSIHLYVKFVNLRHLHYAKCRHVDYVKYPDTT